MARKNKATMRDADIAALDDAVTLDGYLEKALTFPPFIPGVDGKTGTEPITLKVSVMNTRENRLALANSTGGGVQVRLTGMRDSVPVQFSEPEGDAE